MKRSTLSALVTAWALVCTGPLATDTLRQAYQRPPAQWPAPWIDGGVAFVELGALAAPPPPPPSLTRLGRRLFFDTRLSADGQVSCASCHRPDQGWTVRTPLALGARHQLGRRNPPGLHGVASRPHWGWDGAATSLSAQSLRPLTDALEMANPSLAAVEKRIGISGTAMGEALAAFQQTLHRPTRFDRFAQGDFRALDDRELQGLHLFRTRARCANCHFGPTLSDGKFHNLGIAFFGEPSQDLGRHAVTGQCDDVARFRTPSLRHVAQTAPYMHHGLFDSLAGVLRLYARGGGDARSGRATVRSDPRYACALRVSPHLQAVPLSASEIAALLAFLRVL